MKQVLWSLVVIAVAAGILAGMVIYTIGVMRAYERRILHGDPALFSVSVCKV